MAYREHKLIPSFLITAVGGAALVTMLWMTGSVAFSKWFFYPSLLFWIFSLLCITTGTARSWDRYVWKICQWWSGFWSIVFLLCFVPPYIGFAVMPISLSVGVNPFLAGFAHVMIWACVTDILKPSESLEDDAPV